MDEFTTDWRYRAACKNEDPELFFPIGGGGPAETQLEQATAVCRGCPVRDRCLSWAMASGQDYGVWGAMSEDERRSLKRRSARAARGERRAAEPDRELPASATRRDKRAAAMREIDRGTRRTQVAAQVRVSTRTVDRWIAQRRARTAAPAAAGAA